MIMASVYRFMDMKNCAAPVLNDRELDLGQKVTKAVSLGGL
jgi:hypothetical protein